ncbi:MAG: acetylglutamate kinase [Clostridium sp.]|uniref:acetylglutamate kinase n=1 Tax=Clostridium sp. TaxID=1506 RepID=UPI002FCB32E3
MSSKDSLRGDILVNSLPYIQKHYGKTIVIKYGGNAMLSDSLRESVIKDIILLKCVGINPVVVHGGGPHISEFLNKLNIQSKFINGLRYTDNETIELVQMVLAGKVNKDLVSLFQKKGGKAIGLCGMDGALIEATKYESSEDLGNVGEITTINNNLLDMALNSDYIPVVGSIALSSDGNSVYNINADTCASKIAASLKAEKLILLTDVKGVMLDQNDPNTFISKLRLHEIPKLTQDEIIKSGMIPKIDCCVEAIRMGVNRAHIIDGTVKNALLLELFSDDGIGTMIY